MGLVQLLFHPQEKAGFTVALPKNRFHWEFSQLSQNPSSFGFCLCFSLTSVGHNEIPSNTWGKASPSLYKSEHLI